MRSRPPGRPREQHGSQMAEIKENFRLTHKHLRCTPEDRMRKRGTNGLTRFINTSKIGGFLPYNSIGTTKYREWVIARAAQQDLETPKLLDGPFQKSRMDHPGLRTGRARRKDSHYLS